MEELRQAMAEFMQQLARQLENMPMGEFQQGNQMLRPEDLDRMMSQLENMMRQGSRDSAQEMLSQLRDLLDQLQSGPLCPYAARRSGPADDADAGPVRRPDRTQQRLMDETYGEQRGQRGSAGPTRPAGPARPARPGRAGRRRRTGPGRARPSAGPAPRSARPAAAGSPQFRHAGTEPARRGRRGNGERRACARGGDYDTATREQGRALEQLRQGAQSMAEQMLQQHAVTLRPGPRTRRPARPAGTPAAFGGPRPRHVGEGARRGRHAARREILEELRRRLSDPSGRPWSSTTSSGCCGGSDCRRRVVRT